VSLLRGTLGTNRTASVDLQIHAGDESALITRQKGTNVADVLGVRESAERHVEEELVHVLLGGGNADEGFKQAGSRQQRAQRVYADLVFAELCGQAFRCLQATMSMSGLS